MIARWIAPLALGIFAALLAWHVTLANTPYVLMRLAVGRVSAAGGLNRMAHAPPVTAKARAIVRPSPDLLYSSCPFNLAGGPVLIEVPAIAAPYWSLSVFDARTDTAFVRNVRAAPAGVRVALLGTGQQAPAGYVAVRPEGGRGIALLRVLIDRTHDFGMIDKVRRAARCEVAAQR